MAARRRLWVGVMPTLLLMVGVAGCQSSHYWGSQPTDSGETSDAAVDPDRVLLQIDSGGGLIEPSYDLSTVPHLTVYADGRAIVRVGENEASEGLPDLRVVQLSESDLDSLLTAAARAGLLGGGPGRSERDDFDGSMTVVILDADGRQYVHTVFMMWWGLSRSEIGNEQGFFGFLADAYDLVTAAGPGDPYDAAALAVVTGHLDDAWRREPEIMGQPWPLDRAPRANECTLVDGAEARALLELLRSGGTAPDVEEDGGYAEVFFRPLLPHERGCGRLGWEWD